LLRVRLMGAPMSNVSSARQLLDELLDQVGELE
jgi:hypothetical protein